jgi:hypothetical protein
MAQPSTVFRNTAGFGRRMEYWLIGEMLKEGLDVYVPLVDDFGIDAVIRKADNTFIEVQIKSRSMNIAHKDAALFASIVHEARPNYYFLFYSERLKLKWILSSDEFIDEADQMKTGKNVGKRNIWFNGTKKGEEYPKPQFDKYLATDFSRFKAMAQVATPEPDNVEESD